MQDDVERIVRGLSKEQRTALVAASQASWGDWFIPNGTRWDVRRRLMDKGLIGRCIGNPLLTLGLRVRSALLSSTQGE